MAKCHSCGATITWCRTVTGKASPMERADDGTWNIDDNGVMWKYRLPIDTGRPRYRSHFVSCKDAKQWRRNG